VIDSRHLGGQPERFEDFGAIRTVHERAFDPSPAEADLVDALRDSNAHVPELCLVATDGDGAIAGHIAFSRARLVAGPQIVTVVPMGVLPEHQRTGRGLGARHRGTAARRGDALPARGGVRPRGLLPALRLRAAGALGIEAPFEVPDEAWMAYRLPAYTPQARGTVIYAEAFESLS
jgi:predicted N-acetyltransferase YhbS